MELLFIAVIVYSHDVGPTRARFWISTKVPILLLSPILQHIEAMMIRAGPRLFVIIRCQSNTCKDPPKPLVPEKTLRRLPCRIAGENAPRPQTRRSNLDVLPL